MLKSSVLVVLMMMLCLVSTLILSVQSQGKAPTNFMVRQIGINRVRVSWTPPHFSPSRGYLITTDDTPTGSSAGIIVASGGSSRDVGQVPGTVTYWLVALYGTPIVAGPVSGTVRDFSRPINITFSSLTATSVTISWTQPPFSLPMDVYGVELSGARQLCHEVQDRKYKMTTGISTVEFTNLQVFSIYNVTITVTLPSGFTATLIPIVEFTTKTAAPTAPPRNIHTSFTTSRSVSVSWSKIDCIERNGPITTYRVEFQEVRGAVIPGVMVNRTFTASGLTPYTNYTFRVAGVNDNDTGPFTDVISIQTKEETPGPVSNLSGTPKFTSIVLTWSPPQELNGVIICYEITYTVNGNNTVRVNTSDLTTTFTIPSLTPQTRVSNITVTAYTKIGQGKPANFPDQTTLELPVVMNVMVEMLPNTSVNVSWESIDTSEPTISYRVYYYYNQSGNMDVFVNASSNSIVINNLTCNVEYLFYVVVIAEIDERTFTGQRSLFVMTWTVSTEFAAPTSPPPACSALFGVSRIEFSVAIVVTFLLTVILYTSIIFIIYCIYCHDVGIRKGGPAGGMEMDVCVAYGHVARKQSPSLSPTEKVYDNI